MIRFKNGRYADGDFKLFADFKIATKSLVAIIGPSGAGKSTLLNLIAGFADLQSGEILLDDFAVRNTEPAARPVSMIFQDHNSFAHLTAWQNVGLGVDASLKFSQQQSKQIDAALDAVGIAHLAQRKPGEMSGGERQRIALARVLVRQKPVLLLDEAFAALGPGMRREMLHLVRELHLKQGLTTLMVTHQPEDAVAIADRVIFVSNGEVSTPLATGDFFKSTEQAVRDYLGT